MTRGRGSEGETGEWEWLASTLTPPPNVVYPALLKLMRTPRLPAVEWTDAPHRFEWTRPFRGNTKYGFCACAITFRTSYTQICCHNFRNRCKNLARRVSKLAPSPQVFIQTVRWHFTRAELRDYVLFLYLLFCIFHYSIRSEVYLILKLRSLSQ